MKKLLFFLLISTLCGAQNVSPYYPAKQDNAYRGNEPSQLTYYDTSFVQGLIPEFLKNNLGMIQVSSEMDVKTKNIKQIYQDQFSDGKLVFDLSTDVINADVQNPEVVSAVKITGTPERVISFFVRYWDTTIDFKTLKSDIERRQMQDVANLYFNKGKPYIMVKNNTYKSAKEFEPHFAKLLKSSK
ncbi:hypothetical protein EGI11_03205 [Chryseobacterium sp. H3056]|uniref:DUF4252 domain-containing protein n=1 Tax=Kaistella daneshvariae TaxID=2487074 RepID=A0A3N0X0H3_9FLAO|nr:hypothetical protein [Kaistella daneshvariae]ROI09779.1 hypothetical protein EGI11_03205 [Kaistella daneshvariae]